MSFLKTKPKTEQNLQAEFPQGEFPDTFSFRNAVTPRTASQNTVPVESGQPSWDPPDAPLTGKVWMKSLDTGMAGHTRSPTCRDLAAGFLGEMGVRIWKDQESGWFGREDCPPQFTRQTIFSTTS